VSSCLFLYCEVIANRRKLVEAMYVYVHNTLNFISMNHFHYLFDQSILSFIFTQHQGFMCIIFNLHLFLFLSYFFLVNISHICHSFDTHLTLIDTFFIFHCQKFRFYKIFSFDFSKSLLKAQKFFFSFDKLDLTWQTICSSKCIFVS